MMKQLLSVFLFIFILLHSCKKTETIEEPKKQEESGFKGVWEQSNSNSPLKYIEFRDCVCYIYIESEGKFREVQKDTFSLRDSIIETSSIGKQKLRFVNGQLELQGQTFNQSTVQPDKEWFTALKSVKENTESLSNNVYGIGTLNGGILACAGTSDFYYVINTSTFEKTDIWMKGTVPCTIESDGEWVFASTLNGLSLLIHMAGGGMAYEEIGGMGSLSGIAVQPSTPYLWLYSKNDTLYKYQKNQLKIISRTYLGDGISDMCWFNGHLLFSKGSSLIEYNIDTKEVVKTFRVEGVSTIYGVCNINGTVWINADKKRLIQLAQF